MWDLSFWPRDLTHIPCTGRWILNHWTTRQVLGPSLEGIQAEEAAGEMVCARSIHGVFQEQQGGQPGGEEWARARVRDGVRETKGWQEEQRETHRPLQGLSLGETDRYWSDGSSSRLKGNSLAEGICTFSYRGKDEREGLIPCLSRLQQYLTPIHHRHTYHYYVHFF